MTVQDNKKGLQLLSDETLASIVESEVAEHDELESWEAKAAFQELAKRSVDNS